MEIKVTTGVSTVTYSFAPEHTQDVLAFYDNLIHTYQIISYKATLADGSTIHQVVA